MVVVRDDDDPAVACQVIEVVLERFDSKQVVLSQSVAFDAARAFGHGDCGHDEVELLGAGAHVVTSLGDYRGDARAAGVNPSREVLVLAHKLDHIRVDLDCGDVLNPPQDRGDNVLTAARTQDESRAFLVFLQELEGKGLSRVHGQLVLGLRVAQYGLQVVHRRAGGSVYKKVLLYGIERTLNKIGPAKGTPSALRDPEPAAGITEHCD